MTEGIHSKSIQVSGLSRRLAFLASLLDEEIIADIGCDHGLVCIQAVLSGRVKKAYACDLREKPLAQANKNIQSYHLQDQIETCLQNGIEELDPNVKQILIAGMGGRQIEEILERNELPECIQSLLLSPHKDADHLRLWLTSHGFWIEREWMIRDGHYYPVIKVLPQRDDGLMQWLDDDEIILGVNPCMNEDYRRYLKWQIDVWTRIEKKMKPGKTRFSDSIGLARKRLAHFDQD